MIAQKLEHWWVVKCKSPECRGNILMGKIADVEPFRSPIGGIHPNSSCADWEESCPYCGAFHIYSKANVSSVVVDISQVGSASGSLAFRQAWKDSAAKLTKSGA